MKFKRGDLVWHGYHIDVVVDRRFMQGEIIDDAPHPHPDYGTPARFVRWQDGFITGAEEKYLLKIPPGEHGRPQTEKNKEPAEAI